MTVSIRDCRRSPSDRRWIEDVYGEYLESLSDLNTGFFPAIGADGPERDGIFASWFASEHAHPLVLVSGGERVGFALVSRPQIPEAGEAAPDYRMSEFFVRGAHRRQGIGSYAARLIFDRFAGEWEIVEYQRNPGSVRFWRRVLTEYCRGDFTERSRHGEIRQRFRSRPKPVA
ncbi:MAG: GNAT family N-acetyltransferase [Gammaproteobacteria bacterium]|nr:GNAT family N-acetyltransferase [Gammaproteobacteria bacterium]